MGGTNVGVTLSLGWSMHGALIAATASLAAALVGISVPKMHPCSLVEDSRLNWGTRNLMMSYFSAMTKVKSPTSESQMAEDV